MKVAQPETEKQGYSAIERTMFLMTPILFAIVLLGVLYTLFNIDFRNKVLEVGQSVPGLRDVLPAPEVAEGELNDADLRNANLSAKLADLQSKLTSVESELAAANQTKASLEQEIKTLQADNSALKTTDEDEGLDAEQYQAKIQELSSMMAKITPSKAAPILQSMSLDEMVLVLANMRPDDRVRILEKMNPQTAADAVMKLKDNVAAKDLQIAALQARVNANKANEAKAASSVLDQEQLAATFGSMDAKSAAELLIKMVDVSPSKVQRILNAVDNTIRSSILAEMSAINDSVTAQLVTKLMAGS